MPLGVAHRQGPGLSGGVDTPRLSRLAHIANHDVVPHIMLKMGTDVITFYQCHGAKYSRMAVKLGLVPHGHNLGDERTTYKHTLAHCQQVEELTIIEGQLGVSKMVSCRRPWNSNLIHVSGMWVFSICCPHVSQSQVLTLIVFLYSTVCAFKMRSLRCVPCNLGQGIWL